MLADIKKQIDSQLSLKMVGVLLAAVVLSIVALMIMYALGYPAMLLGEMHLIWATLMHLVLAIWSAIEAILFGIIVFGLLIAFLLPFFLAYRIYQKKRNAPPSVSNPPPQSPAADPMPQ
ncbi:MAG: hypothetical protein KGL35_22535 [Bradyrhizobium sp.]|uniref:hypothetical protein n=1 Tax=Bradyrhizobium sp. TaxID=376 RepID=UPI001C2A3265|nr:hypothetical protein [Bradyrhizobium sp.]MBU6461841.1 hypothetical protein [Pseudomonadota bacterium]MDE2066162.1 hypothetical protein [Bradyrhizobium sp.]MDE2471427.1 hypothetical protein [Bradyrhizobium sp.]